MRHRRLLLAVLAVSLLGVTVAFGGGPALSDASPPGAPARAIGVTLDTGPGGEAQAYRLFSGAGANALEAPQPWSTLEPRPGRFRLGSVTALVRGVRAAPAIQVMAIPAAIETTRRSVPPDLRRAAWDSRLVIDRYRDLLRRLAPHLSRQVRYVSIANEADVYLAAHPRQLPAFLRFARSEIAELHRLVPWAKVGVTVTYAGLTSARPAIARRISALGDAEFLTYYPIAGGYRMRSPRSPLRDVPRMVRLASGRPLVIQEAGYPSAPRLHSSPAAQARFVRNLFAAWDRFPSAAPFLSIYSLFDLPAADCQGGTDEVAFLCSLGLRRRDGRPKPAWRAFRAGLQSAL